MLSFALNSTVWHYQRRDLDGLGRMVFYDQRSHGRSDRAPDGKIPGPRDLILTYLPLGHVAERIMSTWTMCSSGAVLNFAESIETVQANLQEVQPTLFFAVPRIWEKIHATILIKLDDASFQLRREGEVVNVEPQVLDVITYLARHRDRMVRKEELLDEDTPWSCVTCSKCEEPIDFSQCKLEGEGKSISPR